MDVIIVSTSSNMQRDYWQKRLNSLRGLIIPQDVILCVVVEDWEGSAGNALGSLYAYQQAHRQIKQQYHQDLYHLQSEGASVAIYHSVGRGQRLYPLTPSENFNKCAVKIPSKLITYKTGSSTIAILEAVIYQSLQIAPYRKGRLSVFWGDQIFIPMEPLEETHAAIDIFMKKSAMPNSQAWQKEEWNNYGFVALGTNNETQLLEKCDFETVNQLVLRRILTTSGGVGRSMGSFSLSVSMTAALMDEFKEELQHKKGFLNADPDLWMPLTLDKTTYNDLMHKKGIQKAAGHYQRLQNFKQKFLVHFPEGPFFLSTNIGQNSFWWDYGSVASYYHNISKLGKKGSEAEAMRNFFELEASPEEHPEALQVDNNSLLIDCHIGHGKVSSSVLVGVTAESIEADECVIIDSHIRRFKGSKSLMYNVKEEGVLSVPTGSVRADILAPEHIKINAELGQDAKSFWNSRIKHNSYSYAELEAKLKH